MRECRRLEDSYRQQIHHHQTREEYWKNSINGHGTVLDLEACLKHEPSWRWDANALVSSIFLLGLKGRWTKLLVFGFFSRNDQWEFGLNDFQATFKWEET